MYFQAEKDNRRKALIVKCISILLAVLVCLVNTPLSFAAFTSEGKAAFTASVTIPSFIDRDYDGMPDGWEEKYGLNPNPGGYEDAYEDWDDDGLTNLEEYRNGTNPRDLVKKIDASIILTPLDLKWLQPLDARLKADVTNNSDYDIVKYEWDFDGNGTYDYASRNPSVEYKFTTAGENNIRLRVTNSAGEVGVAAETINITKTSGLPDVITNPAGIETPIPYDWTFSGTEDSNAVLYQWDLTGNGEYEFVSTKSGSINHTYKDVKRRSFNAHFKATNAGGLSVIGVTGVEIDSLEWYTTKRLYRPKIVFNSNYVIRCEAGEEVPLSGYSVPVGGNEDCGYAKKLEWDFEGDGIYDWTTSLVDVDNNSWTGNTGGNADVIHVYGAPGIYRATLRATTDLEPPHDITITATDHVLVIVEESDENPPTAKAKAEYDINGNPETYDPDLPYAAPFLEGTIPFKVTFISLASHPVGHIEKYEWDFDGDKHFDWIGENHTDKPTYTFTTPGYYMACLRVTRDNGLTDTDYIPVFVSIEPGTYASAITTLEEGQKIAGNSVTLACDVFPDKDVNTVMFQYSTSARLVIDPNDWTNIGLGTPIMSYMTTWDTDLVVDGKYKLRAIVNGDLTDTERYKIIEIEVVDPKDPDIDIYENHSDYKKKVKIYSHKRNSIILYNGTRIDIPIGAIEGDEIITITENGGGFSTGVGNSIDVEIEGEGKENYTFSKDITITMPYSDGDLGGRDENDLVILWNNNGTWEPLYDSVVYPDENFISAKINHFSSFGAGFITWGAAVLGAGGAAVGEGAVSYCFIATAAYGSADAGDVMILREFRDRFLLTNPLGRKFVDCYYKYSPPMAEYIKDKPALKKITRLALKPLVKFARYVIASEAKQSQNRDCFVAVAPRNDVVTQPE